MGDPLMPYARALLDATRPLGLAEEAELLLEGYIAYVEASPEAARLLDDPGRRRSARDRALAAIVAAVAEAVGAEHGGEVDPRARALVLNLLRLVQARKRAAGLRGALAAFRAMRNEADGLVVASVESARALSLEEASRLESIVEGRFLSAKERALKRKVFLNAKVDQSLLSGLRVRVGDVLFDDTLKTRMARMKRHLS